MKIVEKIIIMFFAETNEQHYESVTVFVEILQKHFGAVQRCVLVDLEKSMFFEK